jgi:hypothetical protein
MAGMIGRNRGHCPKLKRPRNMHLIKEFFHSWHLDIPTLLVTLLALPLTTYFVGILRKHGKIWGAFAIEGTMYWLGRLLIHSMAARFSLSRYCRLQLQKENRYMHVPSRSEVKLEIDRVFVNLTLENQGDGIGNYSHNTLPLAGNRIRVIGDPGSGKSSLVKRLFRAACRAAIEKPAKAKLPILMELKNIKVPSTISGEKLGNWFHNALREEVSKSAVYKMDECFDNYSRTSGLLVLLDGLDEVATSEYEKVQAAVIALSEELGDLSSENTVVLTMRTQLHDQIKHAFRATFGKAVFVRPFSPTDVYEFLSRWPFTDRALGSSILAELTDRPTLREMCSNPLVLAMYVAERQSGLDTLTPESRTEFYRRVVEELLVKRRLRQTGPAPAIAKLREQRQRILGRLAYEHLLDKQQPANSLRWSDALRVVKSVVKGDDQQAGETFLDLAKETGLISEERAGESLRFIHLTFCEFLAAYESVDGQKDGLSALIRKHKQLRSDADQSGATRLLEVIPFACGLVGRSGREDAISEVAGVGDNQLLARCFLETKAYEHPSWAPFAQSTKDRLLHTPEHSWNEKWLQDLHLFNVVIRDARHCAGHVPNEASEFDLGDFYNSLVKKQGRSLSRLLAAFATQDALAAFRVAELSGLDLPAQFPGVIISSCDQPPFLSLAVERMLAETDRLGLWATPLAEAGLRSRLVARLLDHPPADAGEINAAVKAIPKRKRWDLFGRSRYTQILTVALSSTRFLDAPELFPNLAKLSKVSAPGSLGWKRVLYRNPVTSLIPVSAGLAAGLLLEPILHPFLHPAKGDPTLLARTVRLAWPIFFVTLSYFAMLRAAALRVFYGTMANTWSPTLTISPNAELQASVESLVFRTAVVFLTRGERATLAEVQGAREHLPPQRLDSRIETP